MRAYRQDEPEAPADAPRVNANAHAALAEFLGASLGLNLLLHIPLLPATLLTGVATYAILTLQRYGVRPIEAIISALVGVIAVSYVIETFFVKPNWGQVAYHSVVPWI